MQYLEGTAMRNCSAMLLLVGLVESVGDGVDVGATNGVSQALFPASWSVVTLAHST